MTRKALCDLPRKAVACLEDVMPGPAPKDPSTRVRRNKSATKATLRVVSGADVPELPGRDVGWHDMTLAWWHDVWSSPMSPEWDHSDRHNVFVLAAIYDDLWTAETARDRKEAAAEYRQQRKDLGLTPFDRRRLEWTIEQADEAQAKGAKRRSPGAVRSGGKGDTRSILSG